MKALAFARYEPIIMAQFQLSSEKAQPPEFTSGASSRPATGVFKPTRKCQTSRDALPLLRSPAAIHRPCRTTHLVGCRGTQKHRKFAQLLRGHKLQAGLLLAQQRKLRLLN